MEMKELVPRGGRDRPAVVDPMMGEGPPSDKKFPQFHAVFGKIWQI